MEACISRDLKKARNKKPKKKRRFSLLETKTLLKNKNTSGKIYIFS